MIPALCVLLAAVSAGVSVTASQVARYHRRRDVALVMVVSAATLAAATGVLMRGAFILASWTATATLLAVIPLTILLTFDRLRHPRPSRRVLLIRRGLLAIATTWGVLSVVLVSINLSTDAHL